MPHRLPLVSVVIPVYDGERYLAEAIESVFAQRHRPLEVIVVDDGSTDHSAAVAQRFAGVRYVRQDHAGQSAARNRGMSLATGDLLAFLDADDVWTARKLELQREALEAKPGLDLVYGHAEQFVDADASDVRTVPEHHRILPARVPSALLGRREAIGRVGPFREDQSAAEVVDWVVRAREAGLRMLVLDEIVLRRRLHRSNTGATLRDPRSHYLSVVSEVIARRRAARGLEERASRERRDS